MKALITGITGQDGSYLAEFLLSKGYEVHGLKRRSALPDLQNIDHILGDITLHYGDLADTSSIQRVISEVQPDEMYNLAAQADVMESFMMPEYSIDVDGLAVMRELEAIERFSPHTKFYQASTSELFGKAVETPQNESTPFHPRSPYAIGKLAGFYSVKHYRDRGVFACNGILFNHASPRRGEDYVDRKVTKAVARIKLGLQDKLYLGNLQAKRDWGYAKEYVEYMWKMLQQTEPDDFILGTGETHTVKEWVDEAFRVAGLRASDYIEFDQKFMRPTEVDILQADYSKAKEKLGFEPKVRFKELVKIMVDADYATESLRA